MKLTIGSLAGRRSADRSEWAGGGSVADGIWRRARERGRENRKSPRMWLPSVRGLAVLTDEGGHGRTG
jgi:hypothetical protein